eukprot:5258499-Amphidinium_carterae.2
MAKELLMSSVKACSRTALEDGKLACVGVIRQSFRHLHDGCLRLRQAPGFCHPGSEAHDPMWPVLRGGNSELRAGQ